MSDKRFFWLKLKEDFFDEKYVKALRRLPQGDSLVIIYLKMQLRSLKTEGIIKYDGLLPDGNAELAMMLDEDETLVRFTVDALVRFGAVERWDNETLYMAAMQELIGSESSAAARMRKHRASQSYAPALQCYTDVQTGYTEKEIDIEIEKETETEIEKGRGAAAAPNPQAMWEEFKAVLPRAANAKKLRDMPRAAVGGADGGAALQKIWEDLSEPIRNYLGSIEGLLGMSVFSDDELERFKKPAFLRAMKGEGK